MFVSYCVDSASGMEYVDLIICGDLHCIFFDCYSHRRLLL